MKKHKGCLIVAVMLCLIFFSFLLFIKLTWVDSAHYTENDFYNYHSLTDDVVKNSPKISSDYYFYFYAQDGPAAGISEIRFNNVTSGQPLVDYVIELGYKPWRDFHGKIYWSHSSKKSQRIVIDQNSKEHTVDFSVETSDDFDYSWWGLVSQDPPASVDQGINRLDP